VSWAPLPLSPQLPLIELKKTLGKRLAEARGEETVGVELVCVLGDGGGFGGMDKPVGCFTSPTLAAPFLLNTCMTRNEGIIFSLNMLEHHVDVCCTP
jgi:hypothetical protein